MALPTSTKTGTLDYTWRGLPQNEVASKTAVNTGTLDYTWRGIPFNGNPAPSLSTFPRAPYMTGVLSIKG